MGGSKQIISQLNILMLFLYTVQNLYLFLFILVRKQIISMHKRRVEIKEG